MLLLLRRLLLPSLLRCLLLPRLLLLLPLLAPELTTVCPAPLRFLAPTGGRLPRRAPFCVEVGPLLPVDVRAVVVDEFVVVGVVIQVGIVVGGSAIQNAWLPKARL